MSTEAAALPKPETAVEHKALMILRAWLTEYPRYTQYREDRPINKYEDTVFPGGAAYDLLHLMATMITNGPPQAVRSNSYVADGLKRSREVYEALRPFIRLTPGAEAEIVKALALQEELAAKYQAQEAQKGTPE